LPVIDWLSLSFVLAFVKDMGAVMPWNPLPVEENCIFCNAPFFCFAKI